MDGWWSTLDLLIDLNDRLPESTINKNVKTKEKKWQMRFQFDRSLFLALYSNKRVHIVIVTWRIVCIFIIMRISIVLQQSSDKRTNEQTKAARVIFIHYTWLLQYPWSYQITTTEVAAGASSSSSDQCVMRD